MSHKIAQKGLHTNVAMRDFKVDIEDATSKVVEITYKLGYLIMAELFYPVCPVCN